MTQINTVDIYIEQAEDFAKPILNTLRKLIHKACPDTQEVIKWNCPHFDYKGMMCSMAAFKKHCTLTFWKGALMDDPHNVMDKARKTSMGQFGRLYCLEDLPEDEIILSYIKEAMSLNEKGIKLPQNADSTKRDLVIPDDFLQALNNSSKAFKTFNNFSYSKKKDYIDWIIEAKRETTRKNRLAQSIEWLSEGKSRNWKYEKC